MSSSLPKILEAGINVFKSNSQIMKNKKCYEMFTLYECVKKNYRKLLFVISINDLFGITLIILQSELNVVTF